MRGPQSTPDPIENAFLTAYPNPDRVGCPGRDILSGLATRELSISHPARLHIMQCSPCFGEFRALEKVSRERRRRTRSLALAATVFLVSALSYSIWRKFHVPRQALSPVINSRTIATDLSWDLAHRSPVRGADSTSDVELRLAPMLFHLHIILPFGSDAGDYVVELRTASRIVTRGVGTARILSTGTLLEIPRLDLSGVSRGQYDFFWKHTDEAWQHIPVLIQ